MENYNINFFMAQTDKELKCVIERLSNHKDTLTMTICQTKEYQNPQLTFFLNERQVTNFKNAVLWAYEAFKKGE